MLDRRELLAAAALLAAGVGTARQPERPRRLVNGHPQAVEVGGAVLADGGNAVDAVVAAALAVGVVAPHMTGLGGYGGHVVVAGLPGGKVASIDFNSTAPAALRPVAFKPDERGVVPGAINMYGWLAAGVPGVLAGLQRALDLYGTRKIADLARPAIRLAREGFVVTRSLATALKAAGGRLGKDPGSAKLFFTRGDVATEGATLKNPDLADLLETLAEAGSVAPFYSGKVAERIAAAFKAGGGLVTVDDLKAYRAVERPPLAVVWNGLTLHTPPPTSGGLTVLQLVAALKALGWPGETREPERSRTFLEALRVAWLDRLAHLGDPEQVEVPVRRLLSDEYAKETAERVRTALKTGKPIDGGTDGRPAGGTIHLNAIDAAELTVSMTYTHGGHFGAQVTVDGLGLTLGHGLSRFDPRPGRANSPGPGKRPLHNMCPTVVTRDGVPVLALGATGGRRIVNAVARAVAGRVGEGLTLVDAVAAPRLHTEGDLAVVADPKHPAAEALGQAGYRVTAGAVATLTAVERDPKTGELTPAAR